MIGLWHAAVGDWLHGSSCVYVSCSLQSISKHYRVGAISLSSRIFLQKGKVFVLIKPTNQLYYLCMFTFTISIVNLNNAKIEQQFLHKTTD
jgi:hypothetical protein